MARDLTTKQTFSYMFETKRLYILKEFQTYRNRQMIVLVLAGGKGTRLWPLSRQHHPKQFLRFEHHYSLFQGTIKRFLSVDFVKQIVIITCLEYAELIAKELKAIPTEKSVEVLFEPLRRNTLGAIALGVRYLEEKGVSPDTPLLVVPTDQLIAPESVFQHYLKQTLPHLQGDQIILFGIAPQRPETGYGYIRSGVQCNELLYEVREFVEKPDLQRAEQYIASGEYFWNAGMFAFSSRTFWKEVELHAFAVYEIMKMTYSACLEHFAKLPNLSIDYALLEHTKNIALCPLPVNWSDVGSWESIYEVLDKDSNENVKVGNIVEINAKNCLIYGGKKLISVIGLNDLLIVDTEDAILICKKGDSQKVKELSVLSTL